MWGEISNKITCNSRRTGVAANKYANFLTTPIVICGKINNEHLKQNETKVGKMKKSQSMQGRH